MRADSRELLSLPGVETKTLLAFFLPPLVKISSVSQIEIIAADKISNNFLILSVVVKAVAEITHWHSPKKKIDNQDVAATFHSIACFFI